MRLDLALAVVIAAMVLFVAAGYPALALLAGLIGVLFIGASGERYKSFESVDVPPAGPYPKWDFWKDLIKDSGEFLGKLSKTFLHTEQLVDKWSDFVKKGVFKAGGSDTGIYMYGPFGLVLPKSFAKDAHKAAMLSALNQQLSQIIRLEEMLLKEYRSATSPERKAFIEEQLKKVKEYKEKLIEEAQKVLSS